MTCIAVDDEPRALDVIEKFVDRVTFLEFGGKFRNPIEAIDYLLKNDTDLVFLDINMPEITGVELVKSLTRRPLIVFTTAYSEYAIESYELNALDYLVKPIEFERFFKAVVKAKEMHDLKNSNQNKSIQKNNDPNDIIYIKSGKITHQVNINDILYAEGLGNYISVILKDRKIVSYLSMTDLLSILPPKRFMRIHKSYIVSLQHIDTFEYHQVILKELSIPIGKSYRKEITNLIKK